MEMFQSNIFYYYVRIKEHIVSTQEMCLEKTTYQHVPRKKLKILANKSRRTKTYQEKSEKLVKRIKILVHAQDSCECTTLLCMPITLVHALEGPGPKARTQQKSGRRVRPGGLVGLVGLEHVVETMSHLKAFWNLLSKPWRI